MKRPKKLPPMNSYAFTTGLLRWLVVTAVLLALSLLFGVWGYCYFEHMTLIDAVLNAAMLLGGMGPVDQLHSDGGKLFAAFYAIYSGLFLVVCGGVLMVPIFHRVLHVFHADDDD